VGFQVGDIDRPGGGEDGAGGEAEAPAKRRDEIVLQESDDPFARRSRSLAPRAVLAATRPHMQAKDTEAN
jgi:hypothetical protein